MDTKFVEAAHGPAGGNWGKFALCRFTPDEWSRPAQMPGAPERSLLGQLGWANDHIMVTDLATGEGAMFRPGNGLASAGLEKHQIWVCPLFEPFLEWLFHHARGNPGWWDTVPAIVWLPEAPGALHGYRRPGPDTGAAPCQRRCD